MVSYQIKRKKGRKKRSGSQKEKKDSNSRVFWD
jgi:hypothetical protein